MPTEPLIGEAVLVTKGSIGNFFDENGNHWICFEHDAVGLIISSYPCIRNSSVHETVYEVLVAGEFYEMKLESLRRVS